MKRFNPLFSAAGVFSSRNFSTLFPRHWRAFALMLLPGLLASCAAPKSGDTAKTESATKAEAAPMATNMSMPMTTHSKPPAPAAPAMSGPAIAVAGELVVNLDARDATAGTETWANKGTLGDFARIGSPKADTTGGQKAVVFNGTSDAYRSANPTPDGLNGAHARSIEVWAFNPSVDSREESMVAWGHRGTGLANMAFSWGNDTGFGAVVNYTTDMGWGDDPPAVGQWHLLTYTYDGKTAKIYDNGAERGTGDFALVTPVNRMLIGAENNAQGEPLFEAEFDSPWTLGFSGSIAVVRVHSGALTPDQVKANFNADKARFGAGQ